MMTECQEFKKAFSCFLSSFAKRNLPLYSTSVHMTLHILSTFIFLEKSIFRLSQDAMRNRKLSVWFLSHIISQFFFVALLVMREEISTSKPHICLFPTKLSKSDFIIPEILKTFITLWIWTLWRRLFTIDMNWLLLC